ncbi:hypothetical protein HZH68_011255 [Vespula germanica]|uniref:Uncharacterized protein n=1 Tax=Vespula germanica TaxID=30212 RepID=A0A834N0A5_VESGE|nr:hypothetical protein HZH68_011255 [Vespula germanica]
MGEVYSRNVVAGATTPYHAVAIEAPPLIRQSYNLHDETVKPDSGDSPRERPPHPPPHPLLLPLATPPPSSPIHPNPLPPPSSQTAVAEAAAAEAAAAEAAAAQYRSTVDFPRTPIATTMVPTSLATQPQTPTMVL